MKKIKLNKQNIFILINVIIILAITCFYAVRLVHYYKIDNPKIKEKESILTLLTLKKNIVKSGNGLYKNKDSYTYKGKVDNNYISYSGRLFRAVSIDKENIKLITQDNQTSLVWGVEQEYKNSYINDWLNINDSNKELGTFYNSLNNPIKYLNKINWCVDNTNCDTTLNNYIGLLSKEEYEESIKKESYLDNNTNWWLSNTSDKGTWYTNSNGALKDENVMGNNYLSFGVRPVINIKSNTVILSGDGTSDNPYKFEENSNVSLSAKNIGEYLTYNGLNWRIIEKNNNYTKVVLDGFIKKDNGDYLPKYDTITNIFKTTSGVGYYLNNNFLNTLNKKYLVKGNISTNRYDSTVDYNYQSINDININVYVGLLNIGDFFINDYNNYFLATRTSTYTNTVYKVTEKGNIYADLITSTAKVRPVIFLNKDVVVTSGNGNKKSPYILGDL